MIWLWYLGKFGWWLLSWHGNSLETQVASQGAAVSSPGLWPQPALAGQLETMKAWWAAFDTTALRAQSAGCLSPLISDPLCASCEILACSEKASGILCEILWTHCCLDGRIHLMPRGPNWLGIFQWIRSLLSPCQYPGCLHTYLTPITSAKFGGITFCKKVDRISTSQVLPKSQTLD
jgi:hypothetical protein